jgi:phage tail sheath protein FI
MNYRTPGVYIEEISNGPRPVQASSTTETGFVAVIEIPT